MSIIRAWRRARSAHPWWVGDDEQAALIDLNSGRIIGRHNHDGHGEWQVDVCLPYWRAAAVLRSQPAMLAGFASFPRCWLSLFRAESAEAAASAIEQFVGMIIIERDIAEQD